MSLVILNAGSSSLKFAVFCDEAKTRPLSGHIDGVGEHMQLTVKTGGEARTLPIPAARDQSSALAAALDILGEEVSDPVSAVGHRIVHGGTEFA